MYLYFVLGRFYLRHFCSIIVNATLMSAEVASDKPAEPAAANPATPSPDGVAAPDGGAEYQPVAAGSPTNSSTRQLPNVDADEKKSSPPPPSGIANIPSQIALADMATQPAVTGHRRLNSLFGVKPAVNANEDIKRLEQRYVVKKEGEEEEEESDEEEDVSMTKAGSVEIVLDHKKPKRQHNAGNIADNPSVRARDFAAAWS